MNRKLPPPLLEFPNSTKRAAYTALTLNDLGSIGVDRDTGLSWRLTAVAPSIEWTAFGDGSGGTGASLAFVESTGATTTTVKRVDGGTAILLQDAGAAMAIAIGAADGARKVLVTASGAISQATGGGGDFASWWPVMTGSTSGVVTGAYEGQYVQDAAGVAPPVYGQWSFDLVAGESAALTFMWGCKFAVTAIAVDPTRTDEPTRFKFSALILDV